MKKSNQGSKPSDPPKPVQAIAPVNDKQDLLTAPPSDISRERLMDGALITTEVLNEILQRQKPTEPMRHWGINE